MATFDQELEAAASRILWKQHDAISKALAAIDPAYADVPLVIVASVPRPIGAAILVVSTAAPEQVAGFLRQTADCVDEDPLAAAEPGAAGPAGGRVN